MPIKWPTMKDRLMDKVDIDDVTGCWLFRKSLAAGGYARLIVNRRMESAHRVSYAAFVGPIPGNMHVLHRCDVPNCINPRHLFLGTRKDNMRDMIQKGRANKIRGDCHPARIKPERLARGEQNGFSKLTADKILSIRTAPGTYQQIAKEFGISKTQVGNIKRREQWKHL